MSAMSDALQHLQDKVEKTVGVADSAVVFINEAAAKLREFAGSPEKINAFADQLDAKADELAAAITANS